MKSKDVEKLDSLAELRLLSGLTVDAFCKKLDISKDNFKSICAGRRKPTQSNLSNARYLACAIDNDFKTFIYWGDTKPKYVQAMDLLSFYLWDNHHQAPNKDIEKSMLQLANAIARYCKSEK